MSDKPDISSYFKKPLDRNNAADRTSQAVRNISEQDQKDREKKTAKLKAPRLARAATGAPPELKPAKRQKSE